MWMSGAEELTFGLLRVQENETDVWDQLTDAVVGPLVLRCLKVTQVTKLILRRGKPCDAQEEKCSRFVEIFYIGG
ncbi:Apolipoprotein B-100 [Frankliniella fusca]|uniref:Apolipoprotein B-100 n=1 Tax=Frankliniella fusca TaxID=407009 RepID=A0AAE1LT56_9NEOP|nr:Apolipoprotein B-100 [Frankliniella fusca]